MRLWLFNFYSEMLEPGLVLVAKTDDGPRELVVEYVRFSEKNATVEFEGIETREEAEALTNVVVHIFRKDMPTLDEDEFYQADLIGVDVFVRNDDGMEKIGRVKGFLDAVSDTDILAVTGKRITGRLLVLMTEEIVEAMSLEGVILAPLDTWAPEGTELRPID